MPSHFFQSVPVTPCHENDGLTNENALNFGQASFGAAMQSPQQPALAPTPAPARTANPQSFPLPVYQATLSSAPPAQTPPDDSVMLFDFENADTSPLFPALQV